MTAMISEEDLVEGLSKIRVKEDKLKVIEAAAREFIADPTLKVDNLAAKYGMPRRTLYYYFKKLGLTKARGGDRVSAAGKQIRKVETEALTNEAEKIATIAIGIGGVIARRYLPLIDHLLIHGKTLEMIAEDVMGWYEMKIPTETRITELEATILGLNQKLAEAYAIAMPNFKFLLRSHLLMKYAKHLLVARMYNLRVPIRPTLRAFNNDLSMLEKDLEAIVNE